MFATNELLVILGMAKILNCTSLRANFFHFDGVRMSFTCLASNVYILHSTYLNYLYKKKITYIHGLVIIYIYFLYIFYYNIQNTCLSFSLRALTAVVLYWYIAIFQLLKHQNHALAVKLNLFFFSSIAIVHIYRQMCTVHES